MRFPLATAALISLPLLLACGAPDVPPPDIEEVAGVPIYEDLGDHHYAVSANAEAQRYFDQGLRLTYAFNHAEAVLAFDEAARLDPNCAMCYWGTALALGPNINAPMDSASGARAYEAVRRAAQAAGADERERALIEALATRYADPPPAARAGLDSAYALAMAEVARGYPDDLEVATLYAEALMDLSPWNYWNADGTPRPATPEILATLEGVLERQPVHPGACHFYIHAVEAALPAQAIPCAERLAGLMPGAGHLVHMPGHIYIRVGRFADAVLANEHAVHADETYIRDQSPDLGLYTLAYYPHNYDFLAFAATMAGRSAQALAAARKPESLVPAEMLGAPGMGPLEQFASGPLRVLVRFGRWDEVLAAPAPAELPYLQATWHWARGMALAGQGDTEGAGVELAELRGLAQEPSLSEMVVGYNSASAVLAVAVDVLAGEIAARRGDYPEAIARLRAAAANEDALTYGEPPDWPVPVRHHLGAALIEAGRPGEAEVIYREDLERFPENGWSLRGLAASLEAQGKAAEAAEVEVRLQRAWEGADLTLTASRF